MIGDSIHGFRRLFQQNFTVHDITEPLASFDGTSPSEDVRRAMEEAGYEIAGFRRRGVVVGYLMREELESGECQRWGRPFDDDRVIDESASLVDLVLALRNHSRQFVRVFGRVGGIVSRTDLEKPAVRMWLFGMITLLEMRFTALIDLLPDEASWQGLLSESRLEKARWLQQERRRRHAHVRLVECLQFADKAQIIARSPFLRGRTRMESRRQVEQVTRKLEQLRNHLAHAQEITATSWETIVLLAENIDAVLEGPRLQQDPATNDDRPAPGQAS